MTNNTFTSNILDSISKRLKNESFSTEDRKALVLFNGSTINLDNNLKALQELQKKGYSISIGYSFMAEKIVDHKKITDMLRPVEVYSEEDIFKLQLIVHKFELLIIPNITINTLSKVTLGMIDSFVPTIIWTFLYDGKSVFMDFSGVRNYLGRQSKSTEIDKVSNAHIAAILKMGAKEMVSNNFFGNSDLNKNQNSPKNITQNQNTSKDLITERDISNLSGSGKEILIEKGTVVTPLAKDRARELGINIRIK